MHVQESMYTVCVPTHTKPEILFLRRAKLDLPIASSLSNEPHVPASLHVNSCHVQHSFSSSSLYIFIIPFLLKLF